MAEAFTIAIDAMLGFVAVFIAVKLAHSVAEIRRDGRLDISSDGEAVYLAWPQDRGRIIREFAIGGLFLALLVGVLVVLNT